MNLFESRVLSERLDLSLQERLRVFFKQKGFRQIGEGRFAKVYSNGRSAVEVFRADTQFDQYLEFAKDNGSPHFPKMIGEPTVMQQSDLKLLKLEPLQALSSQNWVLFQSVQEHLMVAQNVEPDQQYLYTAELTLFDRHPELESLVEALRALQAEFSVNPQTMRPANLLERTDGTIVVGDPFLDH